MFLMELHIAPMKNISCWAFRATCVGATDSYTEMIQLHEILKQKHRALQKIDTFDIPKQRQWLQVLTTSPKEMEKLPVFLDRYLKQNPSKSSLFGVNLNVGCPDPNIIAAGQGAALIKRRKRLKDLILAFLDNKNHNYKISLKFRLGMNQQDIERKVIVDVLNNINSIDDERLSTSIIHFKHSKQLSSETPIWNILNPILDLNRSIIINGHITTPNYIEKITPNLSIPISNSWKSLIKGIMIGRGLLTNPYIFNDLFVAKTSQIKLEDYRNALKMNLDQHPPTLHTKKNLIKLFS